MTTYTTNEVILKAEDVHLSFGDHLVLRDINFVIHNIVRPDLNQGQVVSIAGRSGIGKTQLFKILSGLLIPSKGMVKIGIEQEPVQLGKTGVGIVPQNYILFNHRTVYKNLEIALNHNKSNYDAKQKKEIIEKYAADFHLTDHLEKYPQQLSGGQKQRVSIVQQVLTGNKFILLDEPLAALDCIMIQKVADLLVKVSLLDEYNTLVLVSHDIPNVLAISDRVLVLAKEGEKPGATITKNIDLAAEGLAWRKDIFKDRRFIEIVEEVKGII